MTATGQVTFTDADASDTHTLSVSAAAAHGTATVDPDGTWHYTVSDSGAVNSLAVGEHLADSFPVQVDDHHGGVVTQVVSIDITGTNDAPVITSTAQYRNSTRLDYAHIMTSNAHFTFTDADASDTHTLSVSAAAAHGTATVDPDGTWHYTFSDSGAVNALPSCPTRRSSDLVQVDDHHGGVVTQVVSIDITGTNDAPVITSTA